MSPEWQEPLSSAPVGKVGGGAALPGMGSGYPVGGQRCVGGCSAHPVETVGEWDGVR